MFQKSVAQFSSKQVWHNVAVNSHLGCLWRVDDSNFLTFALFEVPLQSTVINPKYERLKQLHFKWIKELLNRILSTFERHMNILSIYFCVDIILRWINSLESQVFEALHESRAQDHSDQCGKNYSRFSTEFLIAEKANKVSLVLLIFFFLQRKHADLFSLWFVYSVLFRIYLNLSISVRSTLFFKLAQIKNVKIETANRSKWH